MKFTKKAHKNENLDDILTKMEQVIGYTPQNGEIYIFSKMYVFMENGFYTIIEASIILDKKISSTEKILYSVICYFSNNEKGYCFKTNKQLIEIMGMCERQFYRCLDNLKNTQYIVSVKNKNRTFLMPRVNKIYIEAKKRHEEKYEQWKKEHPNGIINIDWLNEEF